MHQCVEKQIHTTSRSARSWHDFAFRLILLAFVDLSLSESFICFVLLKPSSSTRSDRCWVVSGSSLHTLYTFIGPVLVTASILFADQISFCSCFIHPRFWVFRPFSHRFEFGFCLVAFYTSQYFSVFYFTRVPTLRTPLLEGAAVRYIYTFSKNLLVYTIANAAIWLIYSSMQSSPSSTSKKKFIPSFLNNFEEITNTSLFLLKQLGYSFSISMKL